MMLIFVGIGLLLGLSTLIAKYCINRTFEYTRTEWGAIDWFFSFLFGLIGLFVVSFVGSGLGMLVFSFPYQVLGVLVGLGVMFSLVFAPTFVKNYLISKRIPVREIEGKTNIPVRRSVYEIIEEQ